MAAFTADEAVTWSLSGADAGLFSIDAGGVLTLNAPGAPGVYVVDILATDAAGNVATLTFTVTVEANKASGIASGLSVSVLELRANGQDSALIVVTLRDDHGKALRRGGDSVALTATLGSLSPVLDNADGTYAATLVAPNRPGLSVITASVNGTVLSATASVRMVVDDQQVQAALSEVTSAFIHRRMDRMLSAEPQSHHLDRRREAMESPRFNIDLSLDSGEFAGRMHLTGDFSSQPRGRADVAASSARPSTELTFSGGAVSRETGIYGWTEGQFSAYRDEMGHLAARDGSSGILFMSADTLIREGLALGVMLHTDWAEERIEGRSQVDGRGWMVGPYLSAEIVPALFVSARMSWGRSQNTAEVDVFDNGNPYRADSDTTRFLARGSVHGAYELGAVSMRPQADFAYMREAQGSYIASGDETEVVIEPARARIGRVSLSNQLAWPTERGGDHLVVFVNPSLDWDFLNSGSTRAGDELRGSLEIGLKTRAEARWQGEAAIRYDGISQAEFSAWSVKLGTRIDF